MTKNALVAYVDYLQSFPRFSVKEYLALGRIEHLLKLLGNPQRHMTGVQIAGTNGKGSVAATLDAVLHEAGYKVLTFTSPHLVSPTERFRINGKPVSEKTLAGTLSIIKPLVTKVEKKLHDRPTWFEVMLAMAVVLAQGNKVDLLVFEVGLGGRLDGTTALHLPVKIITSITYDHTEILGNTLAKIANEKSGIIRNADNTVITTNTGTALRIIRKHCLAVNAKLCLIQNKRDYTMEGVTWHGTTFSVKNGPHHLRTKLVGAYQADNAALAWFASRELERRGFPTTRNDFRKGLSRINWPGRFQMWKEGTTTVILDGAHNPDAAKQLAATFQTLRIPQSKTIVIAGVKKTKNVKEIVPVFSQLGKSALFPTLHELEHMAEPSQLLRYAKNGVVVDSLDSAWNKALQQKPKFLLVTGSLYLLGAVLAHKRGTKKGLSLRDDVFSVTKRMHV